MLKLMSVLLMAGFNIIIIIDIHCPSPPFFATLQIQPDGAPALDWV